MNININRATGKVEISPSPITFVVDVKDDFNLSKTIEVQDGEIQKTDEQGQLLYYAYEEVQDGADSYFNQTEIETTEARTAIKTEPREVINTYTDEDGVKHSDPVIIQEPVEWMANDPILLPNMVQKTITFTENPTAFTALEVLNQKYNMLLDNTPFDFIQAGIFLNEDKIDLTDIKANTGVAIMQLLPQGYAKSKTLNLKDSVDTFRLLEFDCDGVDILVNDKSFVNNELVLDKATDKIILTFKNTTDKYIDVKSYAIAY